MSEWQKIPDDAPVPAEKDAQGDAPFLVWDEYFERPEIVRQANDLSLWFGDWDVEVKAQFWMPLPSKPEPVTS